MNSSAELLNYFRSHLAENLALLQRLVEYESNSHDKPGIDALADLVAGEFRAIGAEAEILHHAARGNALEISWPAPGRGASVLVLGHLDTVWPRGSVQGRPFQVKDGRAYGPGVFDMKGGILLSLMIGQALREQLLVPRGEIRFLFTSDEEIGTETGLPHLKRIAPSSHAVLCLEPPLPGGGAKTFRKGVASYRVRVRGKEAHAGVDPGKGASAVLELSRLVVELHNMNGGPRDITLSVGTFHGGTAVNVIPGYAEAEVDVRYSDAKDGPWIEERIRNLRPLNPSCTLEVEGKIDRPPLERTGAVVALYQKARVVAADLGMDLGEGPTGGGSDGSFTAAMGIPTLDGLGVAGDGAHALHEFVEIADIPRRAALLCGLIERIGD